MTDQTNHSDANHDDEDRKDDPNGEDQQSDTDQQDESDDEKDDGDDKKPSVFKKPLSWIILVIVVGGLIIGGVLYWLHARQFESTDDAFVDTHIVRLAPQVAGTLVQVADIDN